MPNSLDEFRVTFQNGQTRTLTRTCLVHNYLNNKLNAPNVKSFEAVTSCDPIESPVVHSEAWSQ